MSRLEFRIYQVLDTMSGVTRVGEQGNAIPLKSETVPMPAIDVVVSGRGHVVGLGLPGVVRGRGGWRVTLDDLALGSGGADAPIA
jgi:hypothetical protein